MVWFVCGNLHASTFYSYCQTIRLSCATHFTSHLVTLQSLRNFPINKRDLKDLGKKRKRGKFVFAIFGVEKPI